METLEEALERKDKLYSRLKEVRALLNDLTDADERRRQTERARILREMYNEALEACERLRPTEAKRHKAQPKKTVSADGVGFDFFERCGTAWADIEGYTWTALGQAAQKATGRQAAFLTQALTAAMASLTERQREILMLRYREGLSLAEIGRRLGVHKSSVCRCAKRGLQHLEACILASLQARECQEAEGFDFLRFAGSTDVLTDRQREYLYLLLTDGVTMAEIARYLRTGRSTISRGNRRVVERLSAVAVGLATQPSSSKPRKEDWEHKPEREIAAMLGISPSVYYRLVCRDQAVGGLPRLAYEILRLDGLPTAEIARRLGLSEGTVRAYRRRFQGTDVSALPEPESYTPALRPDRRADIRGILSRTAGGSTIGDQIGAETYQKMMAAAHRGR